MSKGGGGGGQVYALPTYTNQNSVTSGSMSQQQNATQSQTQQAQGTQSAYQNGLSNTNTSQAGQTAQTGSTLQNSAQQGLVQSDIPEWLQAAAQYGIGNARSLVEGVNPVYGGQLSAGLTPEQLSAGQYYQQGVNAYAPYFEQAKSFLTGAAQRPNDINAQTYASGLSGIGQYMNPYVQNVVNSVSDLSQRNLDASLKQTADQAIGAHAYGGSRHGVQEGVATAQNNQNTNNLIAQLMSAGYDKASALLGQDIGNNLQSQLANQNAQQGFNQTQMGVGNALSGLGTSAQSAFQQGVNALMGFGNQSQATNQNALSQQYQNWQYQNQLPMQLAQLYSQIVNSAPHGTSQTSSQTGQQTGTQSQTGTSSQTGSSSTQAQQMGLANTSQTGSAQGTSSASMSGTQSGNTNTSGWSMGPQQQQSSSGLLSGLGALGTIGGMFAAPAGGTSAMSGIGSALGSLFALSDKTMKTDITKMGKDPKTGLDMYAYRYKGDPKSYPKVVGPMAQDIKRKFPSATKRIGGKLAVKGLMG